MRLTYITNTTSNLLLQPVQLMGECSKAHRIQQQPAMAAGRTGSARARVAGPSSPSAPGDAIPSMPILKCNLLLLP